MKILFIANAIVGENPGLSGGEVRFIEIAKAWAAKGHEIHLLSSVGGKNLCQSMGLKVVFHNFDTSKKINRFTFVLRALKSCFFLPASLNGFNEGIVYSTNEMVFDVLPAIRLKLRNPRKIKWATVVHWLPPFPPWKRRQSTVLSSIMFFLNERLSVWLANWFADVLLPVSKSTEIQLRSEGVNRKKIHAVECGVNYDEISAITDKVKTKKYTAVFMKRLQAVKGIFDIIEIWELVLQNHPHAKILIIGEGIDGERAREIVRKKHLNNSIIFSGTIYDPKEKFKKIAQSELFVLPSYEENWAIVIGEAMAAGTPVISYGLKELTAVWKDSFVAVPVGNKIEFSKQIISLLDSKIELIRLRKKAKEFVKQYNWSSIANRELKIITSSK